MDFAFINCSNQFFYLAFCHGVGEEDYEGRLVNESFSVAQKGLCFSENAEVTDSVESGLDGGCWVGVDT